ncbi:hypothetical protein [Persephonella sp.]|nr:hypothetical protein [Aquificota bacterium]
MRIFTVILIALITLQLISSCSVKAAKEKSVSNVYKISPGETKKSVLEKLGKPVSVDELGNFHYEFCSDFEAKERASFHAAMSMATLGLWEVIGSSIEKGKECRYGTYKVVVVFDRDNKVINVLKESDYKLAISIYNTIAASLEKTKNNKKYGLLYYSDSLGWFFIYKNKIDCSYDGKYIKAYFAIVPSFELAYEKFREYGKIPYIVYDVVLFDPNKEAFLEKEIKFLSAAGEVIYTQRLKEWSEIYPDTVHEQLLAALTGYCINKILKEYEEAPEEPEMVIPRPGNTSRGAI